MCLLSEVFAGLVENQLNITKTENLIGIVNVVRKNQQTFPHNEPMIKEVLLFAKFTLIICSKNVKYPF